MKKIILIFAFLNSILTFSQILDCPDYPNPDFVQPPSALYSRSVLAPPPESTKYVFNVKFHIVKNTNGTGVTANYGENEVMNAILILNTHFNKYNIFFKYIGFDVIKNSLYMKIRSFNGGAQNQNAAHPFFSEMVQYSKTGMTNPVYDYNAMNLYIVEAIDISTVNSSAQTSGVANRPGINSAFAYNRLLTATLPHEIGHNFNLLHTHQGYGTANCELVDGSNSDTAGDLVTDTPASHIPSSLFVSPTCGYLNPINATDCMGTVYVNCPVKNFMSTNTGGPCRQIGADLLPGNAEFTQGQANRMREQIEAYYNSPTNIYGYRNAKNEIESLYEPFAVVDVGSSSTSNTTAYSKTYTPNETNTGANVWNCPTYTLRFQKGFNWIFSNSTIGTLNKTVTDQYNYSINNHLVNVQIPYLGSEVHQAGGIECFSSFEPYIKGDVKSLPNLGSPVIMYETLDQIKASDPNLFEQLQSQEYHIITKETESGFVNQKTIFKN
ncbi:hypothetical protein [Flavobacterium sp.]|jgi:hypothetical protein|uniref:hypothetical protein n=1 Tax=Flavobacterium sp. TaxID=239 RepID=UPI0037BE4C6E